MVETAFEETYPASSRVAAVLAAKVVAQHGLPNDYRDDLTQEALLELWRKAPAFDERRAGWRTFSERVVANKLASLIRSMHSSHSGHGKEYPLDSLQQCAPAPCAGINLRHDVRRVLDGVSSFDEKVALLLIDHSAIETGRRLGVARATVYRSIERLRDAFTTAGFVRRKGGTARCPGRRV